MTNGIRLRVADRFGRLIAELEPELGPVSWRLNDVGRLTFTVARTDAKMTVANLQFGNRVFMEFENGLPAWGGVIDPPREWTEAGVLLTAYGGESLLGYRTTDRGRYFNDATLAEIFTAIVQEANVAEDLGVFVGETWPGLATHGPEYHLDSILETVRDSICDRLETADFALLPSVVAGSVRFSANLYERRGSSKPTVALLEGHNLTRIRYIEQGPVVNEWNLAGAGTAWGEGSDRIFSRSYNQASRDAYGLRQAAEVFSDVTEQSTLDSKAAAAAADSAQPHDMYELGAVDLAPAPFAAYDVGDSVRLIAPSYGFAGTDRMVRIWGREFNPQTGECSLVVRAE